MHFNFRRSLSTSAAPPSRSASTKPSQTTASNTNARSDYSATKELPLLPAPATSKSRESRPRRNSKSVQITGGGWRTYWAAFKRQITTGTAHSSSSSPDESIVSASYVHKPQGSTTGEQDGQLDVVVVDRLWCEDQGRSATKSDSNEESHAEKRPPATNTDPDGPEADTGFWASLSVLSFLRWRIWLPVWNFFRLRFVDDKFEAHYVKETWFLRKRLALFSALFFVINWVLPVILLSRPATLADAIFYYCIGPVISVPLVLLVIFDYPRDHSVFYQIYLLFAVWSWPIYQVVYMYLCGYWNPNKPYVIYTCGSKDFLNTFYYTSALQTIALFGLGMNRFPAMFGSICFIVTSLVLFSPVRPKYGRNAANVVIFEAFILHVHYAREVAERRLFTLRDELKTQFKATQKAQVNERKTADSKRRLTSWVRVPLNTALLAVQNMNACNAVDKTHEIEFKALEGSLSMMSKVLNDVLDFNRMDSGKFESYNKPYVFHQIMRSLFAPLKLDADSKKLHLVSELDRTIDDVAGRALFSALGHSEEEIQEAIAKYDGVVLGDENRLRQIITNLAGNAFKFTPAGGTVTIRTKLIIPSPDGPVKAHRSTSSPLPTSSSLQKSSPLSRSHSRKREAKKGYIDERAKVGHGGLSADLLRQHDIILEEKAKVLERIVVRIEVSDTGCGIHEREMHEIKLFNAFNQTEAGRLQGGKGTGLGLALVRQIVKLSGGRLGLRSKISEGSTFWVELPLGIGKKVLPTEEDRPSASRAASMDRPRSRASSCSPLEKLQATSMTSTTHLERVTRADGLVHLVPRKGDDVPEPVPALKESMEVLRTRSMDRPRPTNPEEPDATACITSRKDHPPPTRTTTKRPTYIDIPKPPRFPTMHSPGDRLSPSLIGPPTPENVGNIEITPGLPVLVVDDDKMTRMLMRRMLERLKCVVTTAVNGKQAFEFITGLGDSIDTPDSNEGEYFADGRLASPSTSRRMGDPPTPGTPEGKFSVVFLDNQMPVLSGVEMVRKLRKLGRNDLIVGVTGNALLQDQEEYLAAGADHVLTKPVREEDLRHMLQIADERKSRTMPPLSVGSPQNQDPIDTVPR